MFHKIILKDTLVDALKTGIVCLKSESNDGYNHLHAYVTKNIELITNLIPYNDIPDGDLIEFESMINDDNFVFDVNRKEFCEFKSENFSGEAIAIASAGVPEDDMFLVDASLYLGNITGPVCASERLLNALEGVEIDFSEIGIGNDEKPIVFDIVLAFESEKSEFKSQLKGIYLLKHKVFDEKGE